ncbi:MAG: alanine--tRNA ligase [Rhodospirillales bacterium RIFCSPLOWO2_12_FULL_58_28]|nr:MAG: alanine--tRNA ligase [Rhodospirillales bacterium RIFCSPLOWO2_02_FULL_58_16]OHC79207.1 MAG: alanine--tRNA ligase [Rhodospirillales bacterium RIFCSPLOWO2_12_FULL_58_28]
MQTVNDIRKAFLDFFAAHGHEVVGSSSLVPLNDPTLMFTNAGMVQFKNVFTGAETRPYRRAVTSQKCVRAGGKHNDLENVGYTTRHHTFFEMLGNFSFGDYFKELAIELAWKLVVREYGLAKEKLLVTVYGDDDEAFDLWKKIAGLPDSKILRISTSDNFWAMGPTGPCGPCSEIFYDHGDHIPGGPPGSADENGDRFIEIWNLVFMQFEQVSEDVRHNLPKPSIDTGMGLERVAAVMQGTHDNYQTDLFRALINASSEASKTAADGDHAVSHRVIADHLRASSFLIADGVLPSNEGRGYVLRRIMRRAMRHAQLMGCKEPLMHKLAPTLTALMGQAFPELARAEPLIVETLKLEETRFKQTLERGLKLLDEAVAGMGRGGKLKAETAFKLYDTYGFPLDLTQDALKPKGIAVDVDGFNAAMERRRAEARKAWSGSGDAATEQVWFDIREEKGATEFLGYEAETALGQITALVVNGKRVQRAETNTEVAVVVNQTPFYAESGGQQGDHGIMWTDDGVSLYVNNTEKKLGALHVHIGKIGGNWGAIRVGDQIHMAVDHNRRTATRANHSATHLLHEALRRKLGKHVTQKGSMVSADRLRFDVSHHKAVGNDEIAEVEAAVNNQIRANSRVATHLMTPDQAIEAGAMALFGEKYGDEVRVVSMGDGDGHAYSTELCGGTHVRRTGDIGLFKVIAESAVASGVRRIEALTGAGALDYLNAQEAVLKQSAAVLKTAPADVPGRIAALLDERKTMERDLADVRRKLATGGGGAAAAEIKSVNGVRFMPRKFDDVPAKDLKSMADEFKTRIGSGVVALISVDGGKASLVVGVTEDLSARISAVDLVRVGAAAIGGKGGGGRPDMAQAGGPDAARANEALAAIEAAL